MEITRRQFLGSLAVLPCLSFPVQEDEWIWSVTGKIPVSKLGTCLIHEHILVDFVGADKISPDRWEHDAVISKVLPYLKEVQQRGVDTVMDCTPAFLGRDVQLLQKIANRSGLQMMTNTGYYGASDNKYLPDFARKETARQLAKRWITEFNEGIDGTDIRPGFIKIGVNPGRLSALHQKLISAAALTHLETGLTICSHTGPARPAFEQVAILEKHGVKPEVFVWVHANGNDEEILKLAKKGVWISLDGISTESIKTNADKILLLKRNKLLHKALISHDAGWYKPGEPNGGTFTGFTAIPDEFIPMLLSQGISREEVDMLLKQNPANAFAIRVRKR